MLTKNIAPGSVILFNIFFINFDVSFPGFIPGTNPLFFFISFDIFLIFIVILLYKNVNKIINIENIKLYSHVVKSDKFLLFFDQTFMINGGKNINVCANIIGITPEEFTFIGIYFFVSLCNLFSIVSLAYCIGIFLTAWVNIITSIMIINNTIISIINNIIFFEPSDIDSEIIALGNDDIMPVIIRIDIPFPIPFSVILSPIHMQNIVPEINIIVDNAVKMPLSIIIISFGMNEDR